MQQRQVHRSTPDPWTIWRWLNFWSSCLQKPSRVDKFLMAWADISLGTLINLSFEGINTKQELVRNQRRDDSKVSQECSAGQDRGMLAAHVSRFQVHTELHSEFKVSLDYMDLVSMFLLSQWKQNKLNSSIELKIIIRRRRTNTTTTRTRRTGRRRTRRRIWDHHWKWSSIWVHGMNQVAWETSPSWYFKQ